MSDDRVRRCDECTFWRAEGAFKDCFFRGPSVIEWRGRCARSAPDSKGEWPLTKPDDWCGEACPITDADKASTEQMRERVTAAHAEAQRQQDARQRVRDEAWERQKKAEAAKPSMFSRQYWWQRAVEVERRSR